VEDVEAVILTLKYKFKYICLLFIYFYYSLNDNKKLT